MPGGALSLIHYLYPLSNKTNFPMHALLRLKFLLAAWLMFFSVRSQFYQIRNYNSEQGLPSPEVYGMIQDSKGFMWFATDMGVSRYDGYEFKNFNTENGLPDNTVFGFSEDAKGRIWFRSFSGKLSYFFNDSIYTIPGNKFLAEQIKKNRVIILSMYADPGDTIWLGTTDKSAIKIAPPYAGKNVEWIRFPEDGQFVFVIDDKGLVFGGNSTEKCLITAYTKSGEKIISIDPKLKLDPKGNHRYYSRRLSNGDFISSVNNALVRFNNKKILAAATESKTIISVFENKDGRIVSASNDGIKIHEPKTLAELEAISDFSGKIFTEVLIDRENAIWACAEGQGVFYIPFPGGRYYNKEHGLTESKISCIALSGKKIITGHLDGTLSIIEKNEIRSLSFGDEKTSHASTNRIACVFADSNNDVYAGNGLSMFRLSEDFKSFTRFRETGPKKIVAGKNGMTWMLSDRHIKHGRLENNYKVESELLFNQYVDGILEDRAGVLWVCAMNGLWNYKDKKLHYFGEENKLLSTRIISICEDSEGRLWMATRGKGVIVKEENKFYQVTAKDGLASNMCRDLYIDSGNVVWVGSNSGLSKIKFSRDNAALNFRVDVYSKKQGLLTNEVNYILRRGEEIIVAHNNGISIFNPASIKNNSVPPPVYISGAVVSGSAFHGDSLVLPYSKNYFKVNYTGLSYKNPGALEYKYKMEGLDTSWVYTNYPSAQFQTLNPGDYTFVVYAKNDDGYWSDEPATLHLTVTPAWWQTWWFRTVAAATLLALVYLAVRTRIDKVRRREHEKSILQSKIAETELKALRAQMNPHFLFNAINSVQHFITSNDPDSSQRYLSKFARLIRYVVDNSKPSAIPISKEIEAIKLFLELESVRFENRFEYFIEVDKRIEKDFVQIPSMLIQPYVENAIWHGLMHKDGRGKITIRIELLEQGLKCVIEDDGIGRQKSLELKANLKMKKHKSVGMTITQERLEIINQMNNSRLSVNIIDLADENNNPAGTRVELFIPSV
jgi:ligand-binding sensor domain-containing protein